MCVAIHNQVVQYKVSVTQDLAWVDNATQWRGLQSLVKVVTETRFYISSLRDLSAQKSYELARGHWRVENQLHWQLDITFHEDQLRHWTALAPENLALVRKIALNIAHTHTQKLSKKKFLKKMAWSDTYTLEILTKVFKL